MQIILGIKKEINDKIRNQHKRRSSEKAQMLNF
jgi:hypothetical protein